MTIELTPEQLKSVQSLIQDGTYRDEVHVIGEAIRLLKEKEELRARANAGVRQLDEGHYRTYQPDQRDLFINDIETASRARSIGSRKDSA